MPESRALLLSLRPKYAEAILAGRKTVEVRRRRILATPGTQVVLYATRPTGAVVGLARLRETVMCHPDDAWAMHAASLGISKADFDSYLTGRRTAYLLLLEEVACIDPVSLETLRSGSPFQPPQSFRFVSARDPAAIRHLLDGGLKSVSRRHN